ncbi:conserved hypothetical protein [Uncinocarpus reesii 1704]|uniref:SMODS and SLOG-associating 2TM effector domain-containing protein n=1 Tax=Uncinocarpus reesii (strain UAMH 1704) TaxID=336963 RepID=C4JT10_UNCRE|nr:uncharacterized protein UREG_05599 [Uncinocarpus reesii 1704]EEP80757.1 conserved hypothetical protein [Uncinocarpus reesii 1704]
MSVERRESYKAILPIPPPSHHHPNDPEGKTRQDSHTVASASTATFRAIPTSLLPTSDRLAAFRVLTGIDTSPGFSTWEYFQRSATNIGIYARVVRAEKRAGFEYRLFSILINFCLGLQIIVAASLTALGAGNGPRGLVTAFGAINTVIAGFLTYLKGSGLPNRKRYYHGEWTKVRQYIEQREREFCLEGCELDLEEEVAKIDRMYEDVRAEIEANTPDNYASVRDARNRTKPVAPRPEDELPSRREERVGQGLRRASDVKSLG